MLYDRAGASSDYARISFLQAGRRASVSSYVLKMKSYIDNLERLGHLVTLGLGMSLILISLRKEFDGFVQNYNMHSMGKTINELHAMLKLHEQTLTKNNAPALHVIRSGKVQKGNKKHKPQPQLAARGQNQGKGKNKLAYAPKPKIPPPPKREDPAKNLVCHQCEDTGYWKRNCPQYLTELLKNKKLSHEAIGSGIFTIELCTFPNNSCVYDTGRGTHICNTTQGLRGSRKQNPCALSLYVGNGQCTTVEEPRFYHLSLLSGLVIVLNNFHYAPSITRGIISVSRLYDDGYVNQCVDNSVQVSRNNMVYFSVVPRDARNALRSCNMIDFSVQLTLGLLKNAFLIVSRQGASYFITFTNDVSRCGYVYLLKHKHEVLETFKVFQKEVENQLGKTIKSLRSDREGEYISQEFLDHLKDHGIIAHRTPPYTPQHNGVSKRINRTLLDTVRSMMSQTTLPKSFWDYALETVARILNMVPTNKVEKIPYEVWHGQAPKLSYLKSGVSAKQSIFTTSSAEAEYIVTFDASKEAVWVRKFIYGLDVVPTIKEPISMYCDNTEAITIANESGITKGARHFRAKVHYLREVIEYGDIKAWMEYVSGGMTLLRISSTKHKERPLR
nr:retrotransposon protein, putative, Ty1-copia subclass [Tanacetum cinerariifolium]